MTTQLSELTDKARAARPDALPGDLAAEIIHELHGHPDALDVVRPAVALYVGNRLREGTRAIEESVLGRRGDAKVPRVFDPVSDTPFESPVTALLERWFSVGGRAVRWADATCDDLRERIAEQEARAADILAATEVYRTALAQMEAAGVKRFGDLFVTAGRRRR